MKYSLLVFSLLLNTACLAQTALNIEKMNVAYTSLYSPLTIAVEGVPAGDIIVTSASTGDSLEGENSHYSFTPRSLSDTCINIFQKTRHGLKKIGSATFRLKNMDVPVISMGSIGNGGSMSSHMLQLQVAPAAIYVCCEIDAKARIFKCKVIVTRDGDIIFEKPYYNQDGVRFDDETKNFFRGVRANDIVWITDIHAKGPYKEIRLRDAKIIVK